MPISMIVFFIIVVAVPILSGVGYSCFQRWLQYKERMAQLIADQTAEKAAQYAAQVSALRPGSGPSRRSSPTAAPRRRRRSKRCAPAIAT
jgi:hypothetical protein